MCLDPKPANPTVTLAWRFEVVPPFTFVLSGQVLGHLCHQVCELVVGKPWDQLQNPLYIDWVRAISFSHQLKHDGWAVSQIEFIT